MYDKYVEAVSVSGVRKVSFRSFVRVWHDLLPFIKNQKPATDLCWYCQQRSLQMQRSVNQPDSEKSEAAREMMCHLEQAAKERSLYNSVCEEAKRSVSSDTALGPHDPCSFESVCHYSFDFAQQVHYPCNPQQPGPIFFKTPRKCGLFGVSVESLKKQVNFVIDESWGFGKGANAVVSLIHFFFLNYGLGEKFVHLHADNCCGQNKNNTMMQYLLWRVLTGRHKKITLSFLLAGHTKFAPDWGFGLVKRQFRKTVINCLEDITDAVKKSAPAVSLSQLCASQEGEIIVPVYDWTSYLAAFFKKLPGLLKFHHFTFKSGSSVVAAQEFSDSPSIEFDLSQPRAPELNSEDHPPELQSSGLGLDRQWYLYREIRQFVEEGYKDLVAPLPKEADRPEKELEREETGEPVAKSAKVSTSGEGAEKRTGKGKGKGKGKPSKK